MQSARWRSCPTDMGIMGKPWKVNSRIVVLLAIVRLNICGNSRGMRPFTSKLRAARDRQLPLTETAKYADALDEARAGEDLCRKGGNADVVADDGAASRRHKSWSASGSLLDTLNAQVLEARECSRRSRKSGVFAVDVEMGELRREGREELGHRGAAQQSTVHAEALETRERRTTEALTGERVEDALEPVRRGGSVPLWRVPPGCDVFPVDTEHLDAVVRLEEVGSQALDESVRLLLLGRAVLLVPRLATTPREGDGDGRECEALGWPRVRRIGVELEVGELVRKGQDVRERLDAVVVKVERVELVELLERLDKKRREGVERDVEDVLEVVHALRSGVGKVSRRKSVVDANTRTSIDFARARKPFGSKGASSRYLEEEVDGGQLKASFEREGCAPDAAQDGLSLLRQPLDPLLVLLCALGDVVKLADRDEAKDDLDEDLAQALVHAREGYEVVRRAARERVATESEALGTMEEELLGLLEVRGEFEKAGLKRG